MSPEPKTTAAGWARRAHELTAAGDLKGAFDSWQAALSLEPDSLDIAGHLASLAFRLGQWETAEKLYAHLITHGRQDAATLSSYAATLREQARYDEALDILKTVVGEQPGEAMLWEGLGAVMTARGDNDTALTFIDEALRLDPSLLTARFHRGCILFEKGEVRAGLKDLTACAEGFRDPDNRASAAITCAHACMCLGELAAGWRWYEARHKSGTVHEVAYDIALPRLGAGQAVAGKRLFVSTEQGLGDEVLFGSLLPEIAAEAAHIGIGVEPRLVSLFQRSFPEATIIAHHTEARDGRRHREFPALDESSFDAWALMGDFLASRRARLSDFPKENAFLTPDPARVAHWRAYLAALGPGPKVGVLWKSLKSNALRDRSFSPFEQWKGVLATPGATFINLQYGDIDADMAEARAAGIAIHAPMGIDLKLDLDDIAALCVALDIVIGPSNATTNIAAACGAHVWLVSPLWTWLAFGEDHYPWYPSARLFKAQKHGDWPAAFADVSAALDEHIHAG